MKLKKGDKVQVIAGKDKGKTGTISVVIPETGRILVDGVNVLKKHQKARQANKGGQIVEKEFPIHHSNVMVIDSKTNTPTRIGIIRKDGKRIRVAKKSGTEL